MEVEIRYSKSPYNEETIAIINEGKPYVSPDVLNGKGLGVLTTCVFIVGVIAGTGFLTLPKAIDNAGWIGFLLVLVCCFLSAYTGHVLGKCWTLAQERNPDLTQGSIRYPYPAIGELAYGTFGRYLVSLSLNFTQFGGTVVLVLLAAENIVKLLPDGSKFNCCLVALTVGCVMTPFTWLGTPKEFWGIAVIATLATATTSIILFVSVIIHSADIDVSDVTHSDVTVTTFFTAYGTICFAYNGHSCFPTFQSDMKEPKKFGKALFIGYLVVFAMYTPSSSVAYFIYGSRVEPNILNTLPMSATTTIISLLMTAHILSTIVIGINPLSQEIEHVLKVPERFTWKRILTRTVVMGAVLFVALSVPHFSSVLALVGGSTITILSFICPPLFYLKLCKATKSTSERYIPLHTRVLLYEIIFVGLVAGIATSYSAVSDLASNKFTVPCYVDAVRACPAGTGGG
ncbi:uncharacterized protein LOC127841078 [Dreissena polymorpha]|uniref:Amino acid transporter transmembrane domain-containing protein n=1 Tax=Dreissena polymorpha TaxID=45954 RepID=A0A9D4IRR4_DREPO|nr:uncharacterized protein LOC127841078 [Dreissena polymorpha]KAH3782629.1 hypothetical protein DPMN_160548 [Dreissena polymorpha]